MGNNIPLSPSEKEKNSLSITLDDIILFLQNYKDMNELTKLQNQIEDLKTENQSLLQRITMYEEEYRMLLNHIDKTRNLIAVD
ncbi:transcription factor, RsfA family (plasmid) [Bacillus cereus AH1134]|nr:transcription factor, RsfA family [Bacillus cereus AH1134]